MLIAKALHESASIGLNSNSVGKRSPKYEDMLARKSGTLRQAMLVQRLVAIGDALVIEIQPFIEEIGVGRRRASLRAQGVERQRLGQILQEMTSGKEGPALDVRRQLHADIPAEAEVALARMILKALIVEDIAL